MSAQIMTSYPVSAAGRKRQFSQALQATQPHLRDRVWHRRGLLSVIVFLSVHYSMEVFASESGLSCGEALCDYSANNLCLCFSQHKINSLLQGSGRHLNIHICC